MADVLFWVQHLLGIGHLARALTLSRAMRRAGLAVTLASGGLPVEGLELDGVELVQLEPVQSDGIEFGRLRDAGGRPIDEAFKQRRRQALLDLFHKARPRLVMLEHYPFGRRQMRFELEPLIEAVLQATPRPLLAASVRDILVRPAKPERAFEMLERARAFDRIFVHGDGDLVPFERTFAAAPLLGARLIETGYVVEDTPRAAPPGDDGREEIIVSAGGGRVGERLLRSALEVARTMPATPRWRVLVGQHVQDAAFASLAASSGGNTLVERARPDFAALLPRAALSISQGGYNTVMEVLAAGCRAILVPYAGGQETEQALRARLLAERGLCLVVDEAGLDAATLEQAVQDALRRPAARGPLPRMDGARRTARLLLDLLVAPDTRI